MKKPRLLIISYTKPLSDPRVFRQINFLADSFEITVAGLNSAPDDVGFLSIDKKPASSLQKIWWAGALLMGNSQPFLSRYRLAEKYKGDTRFDLVLVNDVDPFPLAFELAAGAPVFFDAHEYYPREFDNSLLWRRLFGTHYLRLCREFIPRCAGMSTVCNGLAEEYERQFGIRPIVTRNLPAYESLTPRKTAEGIRLIHHGVANPARCLELMIEMMDYVDERFSLDFMLTGDICYRQKLQHKAAKHPRIKFLPPVPMPQICSFINQYDLGIFLLPPVNFNYMHALPNKLFEFIQARLGIVIGPSPEMSEVVKKYNIGIVADDFSPRTLAAALNCLSPDDVMMMKNHAHTTAAVINAAEEMDQLRIALMRIIEEKQR